MPLHRLSWLAALAAVASATVLSSSAAVSQTAPAVVNMAGTWDLTWQARRGPQKRGYLVVTQSGTRLVAQIHGQGSVHATGSLTGAAFDLRGSRMAIPYTIRGQVTGERLEGSLQVLSINKPFSGSRRSNAPTRPPSR